MVKHGDKKLFECKVIGTPAISIHWFRDGIEINQSRKHGMTFSNSMASLEICDTGFQDSGVYYCEACNEAGSESCSMELAVKGGFNCCLLRKTYSIYTNK